MGTIMPRKAAEHWWNLPINGVERPKFVCPPDVAYYESDEYSMTNWKAVTWRDVHKKRTERIKERLEYKRKPEVGEVKPCIVWVFYVDSWLMGGWYTIIKTLHDEWYLNFRGKGLSCRIPKGDLKRQVMEAFPLCIPMPELFDEWMKLFAKKYRNRHFFKYRKMQGTATAWCMLDRHGYLMGISRDKDKLLNMLKNEN